MRIAALDLSKTSTGWAAFDSEGSGKPIYGSWVLGSSFTSNGGVFAKLHECMADLHSILPFDICYIEEAINPSQLQGFTNIQSLRLASGNAAHAESFCYAYGVRFMPLNVGVWRGPFIGKMEQQQAKAEARALSKEKGKRVSARDTLKRLSVARAKQLGFTPKNDDEADAIGILDYAIEVEGMTPPWRVNEVLRTPL